MVLCDQQTNAPVKQQKSSQCLRCLRRNALFYLRLESQLDINNRIKDLHFLYFPQANVPNTLTAMLVIYD